MAFKRTKPPVDDEVRAPKAPKQPRVRGRGQGGEKTSSKGGGRFTLIIGDDGAILVYMEGNTVVRRLFAPSPRPDHTASITELMQAHPKVPLYILADVLDQQYVRHAFPPVSSFSVKGLVERRMERDFQAEDLKGMLPFGREKTGRKEWNYLLIALANTPLIQQWLELIVEQPNELKGIYLVPVETQNYIPALKKELGGPVTPWQLLLTHNKVSGFRQVVLKDGKLVFTRVTQAIDEGVAAVIAGNIEQEILSTIEYLRRLGFNENNELELFVISAQEVKETLDVKRFGAGNAHVLTPIDVADTLDLQQAALSADRFGDVVMASWFARTRKRTLKLQTAYGEKLSKLYMAQRALMGLAALAAIALLGLAAMNVWEAISVGGEADAIEQQRAPLGSDMGKLRQQLDALDKNVAFKSAVVSVHDVYLKDAISPLDFLTQLAPNISGNLRVKSVDWTDNRVTSGSATAAPPASVATDGPLTVLVTMELTGQYQDVETLTNAADEYVSQLKANMAEYAVDVEPYGWMQGASNSMEISFDQKTVSAPDGGRELQLTFRGPKPKAGDASAGASAGAGAAPMGAPGGAMGGPGGPARPGMTGPGGMQ